MERHGHYLLVKWRARTRPPSIARVPRLMASGSRWLAPATSEASPPPSRTTARFHTILAWEDAVASVIEVMLAMVMVALGVIRMRRSTVSCLDGSDFVCKPACRKPSITSPHTPQLAGYPSMGGAAA